jgi:hypothetical protein
MNMKAHQFDGYARMRHSEFLVWREARRASEDKDNKLKTNRITSCGYCGSCRPDELAKALQNGAHLSSADRKYGWPHKFYVEKMPNPFPGEPEIRTYGPGPNDIGPAEPAGPYIFAKFYTEHLMDASPEDRDVIEKAMGMRFEFGEDSSVKWKPY